MFLLVFIPVYTVLSHSSRGIYGSAVCGFTKDDIEAVFDGDFKEQADSTSLWLAVSPSLSQRPGLVSAPVY